MLETGTSKTASNDGFVKTQDDVELYYRKWFRVGVEINSAVLFIHGIGLHGGSPPYGEKILIKQLLDHSTAFYSMDLPGHGRSGGSVDGISQDTLVRDIDCLVERIKGEHKNARIFIHGHNFGGILSLYYASLYPHNVCGVIVSEYSTRVKEGVRKIRAPNALVAIKDRISEGLYHRSKKFQFLRPFDYKRLCEKYGISMDQGIMESLETSIDAPKCMLYGKEFFAACGVGREARIAKSTTVPVLMIFSRKDAFFDIRGAYDILTKIASFDKEMSQVDAAGHYRIVEASRDVVGKWVLARV